MKIVRMLQDHEGARAGDLVGFEDDREAAELVAQGKAEPNEPAPAPAE